MGAAGSSGQRTTPGERVAVFLLRFFSALVAIGVLGALTADLAGKSTAPPPSPSAEETPDEQDDVDAAERRREKRQLVHLNDPTVYDAQEELKRCTRTRGSMGPSSRGPGLRDDIRKISGRVERLRDLDFARRVDAQLISPNEVGERFSRGYLRRYSPGEAERDQQVLTALGLLPEGTDLRGLTSQLLSEGVAGYYNPRTRRLFAGSTGAALAPFDEIVLAHELDHALTDQALGLPGTLSRDPMLGDVMLAHQALAEGDATLLMTRYAARRYPAGEFDGFMARFTPRSVQAPTTIPYYLARSSEFPYYEGLLFACSEWSARGWGAVDEMYLRPPASTADVLFPFRYRQDNEAELPPAPSSPGRSWGAGRARSFGAFDLMVLLENAELVSEGETIPGSHVDAVRGWNGGVLHAWMRGDQTTIHIGLVDAGVKTRDGRRRRLCGVLRRWVPEAFPGATPARARIADAEAWRSDGDLTMLRCSRAAVELAKGPSGKAVRALLR